MPNLLNIMRPTILIFDQGVGAVRNVHTDLEPYLTDEFNIIFHDWHYTNDEFYEKEKAKFNNFNKRFAVFNRKME